MIPSLSFSLSLFLSLVLSLYSSLSPVWIKITELWQPQPAERELRFPSKRQGALLKILVLVWAARSGLDQGCSVVHNIRRASTDVCVCAPRLLEAQAEQVWSGEIKTEGEREIKREREREGAKIR